MFNALEHTVYRVMIIMNGCKYLAAMIAVILMVILPSALVLANENDIFHTKLGCMSCHAMTSLQQIQSNQAIKKKPHKVSTPQKHK